MRISGDASGAVEAASVAPRGENGRAGCAGRPAFNIASSVTASSAESRFLLKARRRA